jgi:drug/metabolite transporter (DMT)-like permease
MSSRAAETPSAARIWVALGAVYLIWSTTFVGIRVANETIPPLLAGGFRFLIAGGLLLPIARRSGDREGDRPTRTQWRGAAVVGLLLMFGGNGGIVWAERTIPSGVAGVVIATVPLWMVAIDRVLLGRRQPPAVVAGIVIGFAGAAVLVGGAVFGGDLDVRGLLVAVGAAAAWAFGSIYQRHAQLPRRPFVAAGMEMLVASGAFLLAGAASGELGAFSLGVVSRASAVAIAYLVVFGSWIGFTSYLWLLRVARTSLVATYAYVTPVGAVIFGRLLLNEHPSTRTLLAGAMIVAAVVLIVSGGGAARRPPSGSEEGRAEIEPEVPLQGLGSTEEELLLEHGRGDLETDREPG